MSNPLNHLMSFSPVKELTLSLLFLILSLGANASPELKRINILVSDLDRSLEIYEGVIGMEVFEIKVSKSGSYAYEVFDVPSNAKLRFASLNVGSEKRAFALTEVTNAELPKQEGIKMATAVIKISNLRQIYDQILDIGLKTTRIDEDRTPEGSKFLEFSFIDYDGNLIVLYELK